MSPVRSGTDDLFKWNRLHINKTSGAFIKSVTRAADNLKNLEIPVKCPAELTHMEPVG